MHVFQYTVQLKLIASLFTYRCQCTSDGTPVSGSDEIERRDITSTNLKYITMFRATQHGSVATAPTAYSVTVTSIMCDQEFP